MDDQILVPKDINPLVLFSENGLDPILEGIKKKAEEFISDISTAKGRKEIASFSYKIAQSKTFVDKAGKELVAKQKAEIKLIDKERKRARDFLDDLKTEVRKPLTEWEESEKAREEAERLNQEFEEAHAAAMVENELFDRKIEIERKEAELKKQEEERIAKEEADRLENERIEREKRLKEEAALKAKKEAEEKAKRENEEAIKKEREARRTAEEAERKAREEKEQAERNRIAAEERAKIEKEMAIKKANEEAQKRFQEEKIKRDRERAEAEKKAEKKAANKRHQKKINNEILNVFKNFDYKESVAMDVIKKVASGKIPHMRIEY